ncbi:PDZ domain-containing protein [Nocardioides sp.]|uniref:YlbL family protein n=1 Tax=Nocardioides sp. TaxID=35761 RepID=UPI003566F238
MTQRTLAGILAAPLVLALLVIAATQPLPYVTYEPGLTVDVLGDTDGAEIIQINGQKTYRDDGELRMTTVYVSQPDAKLNLFDVMSDWISREDAVYPYKAVYRPDETTEQSREDGAVEMVSSQDAAIAVALAELGYDVEPALEVLSVSDNAPADGRLKVRDVFRSINGTPVEEPEDIIDTLQATPPGEAVTFEVLRGGEPTTVRVVPTTNEEGNQVVGIRLGTGYVFPFQVSVNIADNIGGPSAGLMFSLGIYDTLTPGSLTDGRIVAGTGTINGAGQVGPIGGIQQKIVAARDAGAELFLVPPDNCADALGSQNGDMRLVRAPTMHSATDSIKAWVDDPDADLPTCKGNA